MIRRSFVALIFAQSLVSSAAGQDLNAVRDDQINRLKDYVVAAIQPSGLVRDSVVLNGTSFHPATPDAAGFALVALSALNHVGKFTNADAEQRVVNMNITTGAPAPCCWDASYTPIGTALLVAGAQFARNHFAGNATIASLTDQLTNSVNFNNAIKSDLSGGIYLNMGAAGGGTGGTVVSWNEFMLVESLALRETNNSRALAVKHKWLDADFLPKRSYAGIPTLTDNVNNFAPAFWVQQMQFFNGDFRHDPDFQTFFTNQQQADQLFSATALPFGLGEAFRYGLTAGVSPQGYNADSISNHPNNVLSPEAVAAWGDMDSLLQFHEAQNPGPNPSTNPSYKYGMTRVSQTQPSWIPNDAGLVDHLFLLFGLVETLDANFFADRVFPALAPGDYNADGVVDQADYTYWRSTFASTNRLAADGSNSNLVDAADYVVWRKNMVAAGLGSGVNVPEPCALVSLIGVAGFLLVGRNQRRMKARQPDCGNGLWLEKH
jgi:hypothetical protein